MKPRVRFAPSPTGFLHIGGARTALFNWLYARHTGGKFLLRIEDTDRERSKPEHVAAILDSLKWLQLDWDGEPLFQFARADRHREVARELLVAGKAYNCYLSADELAAMRAKIETESAEAKKAIVDLNKLGRDMKPQEKEAMRVATEALKQTRIIQSPWRDADPKTAPSGIIPAIRLKTARTGETVTDDQVQGRVVVANKDLDDMIILRSDGAPTYNFAVVVDDHDMGVTNVIRGVDHLTNTTRQTQVYTAMGWELPAFAHIPLVHGADGAKLSKRHGAQGTDEYRAMGYLPAALRNYLARLGWSHGDDELFSTAEAISWFDVADVGKSPARFDFAKLSDLNGQYIRQTPDADLLVHLAACLPGIGTHDEIAATIDPKAPPRADFALMKELAVVRPDLKTGKDLLAAFRAAGADRLAAALPSLKERAKTLPDLAAGMLYLIAQRPLKLDDKALKLLDGDAKAALTQMAPLFDAVPRWEATALESVVRQFAETNNLKLGKIAQPLRAALTGRAVSPPVFDVMAVLGKAEAMARIKDQV